MVSKQKFGFGLARPGQNRNFVLRSTGGFVQRDVSPCILWDNVLRWARRLMIYPFPAFLMTPFLVVLKAISFSRPGLPERFSAAMMLLLLLMIQTMRIWCLQKLTCFCQLMSSGNLKQDEEKTFFSNCLGICTLLAAIVNVKLEISFICHSYGMTLGTVQCKID